MAREDHKTCKSTASSCQLTFSNRKTSSILSRDVYATLALTCSLTVFLANRHISLQHSRLSRLWVDEQTTLQSPDPGRLAWLYLGMPASFEQELSLIYMRTHVHLLHAIRGTSRLPHIIQQLTVRSLEAGLEKLQFWSIPSEWEPEEATFLPASRLQVLLMLTPPRLRLLVIHASSRLKAHIA
jgi:hypothetical protein